MADTNPNARKEVNDALVSSGSAAIGQMVDTANSSIEKRRRNKEEREKREAEEKAAQEKAHAAVRPNPEYPLESNLWARCVLTVINNRRAAPLARHGIPRTCEQLFITSRVA